jgi:hypothetical protein
LKVIERGREGGGSKTPCPWFKQKDPQECTIYYICVIEIYGAQTLRE